MMIYIRWIRVCLILSVSLLALTLVINLLIDPYGVYRLISIEGFNANKHMGTDHAREINYHQALDRGARSLAMGNSRVAIAIDPQHPGWRDEHKPVYNLSLPGAAIDEIEIYLKSVLSKQPLKKVVIGIDLMMFLSQEYQPANPGYRVAYPPWTFHSSLLLSLHSLRDSFSTLRKQDRFKYPAYREDGMMAESFKANRVARNGYLETFHWAEEHYLKTRPNFSAVNPVNGASRYDCLRGIIQLSRQHDFELELFISPMHARYLELLHFSGLWEKREEWVRDLLRIVQEEALLHPDKRPVVIWDFSGYNSITTEKVPMPGNIETAMNYYWETSHYKKAAGDLVLDRMFGYVAPDRELPEDFGVRLDLVNIEDHLRRIRLQRETYRRQRPREMEDLNALRMKYWGDEKLPSDQR